MSNQANFEESYSEEYASEELPPTDIVVFNELRSCADLFRLHKKDQIDIQPFFQRDSVWAVSDQTRFIDSLVKQLPIPSMCFALDFNTRKWIVIDGLQRMTAIIKLLDDKAPWPLSNLKDIDPSLAGVDTSVLHNPQNELHGYLERVENLTLPITVLRCNFENEDHMEHLFKIFHRLNTGGLRLSNQEVRNCIYSGPLNSLLIELDKSNSWKAIKPSIFGKKDRFRSVELILRILAFVTSRSSYKGNLARFLNDFMFKNRKRPVKDLQGFESAFLRMCDIVLNRILPLDPSRKFGFTFIEALSVALISNIDAVEGMSQVKLKKCYTKFSKIELLSTEALSADISRTESVKGRLEAAINSFK